MILSTSTGNNGVLYNRFQSFIDKHLNYAILEEQIRNYSYKQFVVLKLYAAFNIVELLYNKYNTNNYTLDELYLRYDIYSIAAELQKYNININDIFALFTNQITITTDLKAFKTKYIPINRLSKLSTSTPIVVTSEDVNDDPINIYQGTNRQLTAYAGYTGEPRPYIQTEWSVFRLYLIQTGTTYLTFYWDSSNGTEVGTYPVILTTIAGEIKFNITSALSAGLPLGLMDLRLEFTQNDTQSDVFENTNALNIKA